MSFHTGPTLDPEGEDEAVLPSVPGPESGWGYPFISLLLVPLQWSCLLGFYPVGALGIYKGLGGLWSSQCPWCFLDLNLVLLPVRIFYGLYPHNSPTSFHNEELAPWLQLLTHLYGLLLVRGPRASHKPPSVEEGWWAPSSRSLPRVLCPLPFAARFCPTRGSLCHHGWWGSRARPRNESSEPPSIGGIAAALHWHPPRPSYIGSFCTLGRQKGSNQNFP